MKTSAVVSLRYVVSSVLNEKGLDDKVYERYLQFAIEGLSQINLNSSRNIEVAYKTVSDINTVSLPDDCVDVTVVGYNQGNRLRTLTREDLIPLPRTEDCGEDTNPYSSKSVSTDNTEFIIDHYNGSQYVPPLYGQQGGANVAYYRLDWERRRIILQGTVPGGELILEYLSTGINLSGNTYVPRQWVECLKAYVHWKSIEFSKGVPMGDKDRKRNQYWDERRIALSFDLAFSLDDYLDAKYSEYKRTIKR